jgi:hypothetical protein
VEVELKSGRGECGSVRKEKKLATSLDRKFNATPFLLNELDNDEELEFEKTFVCYNPPQEFRDKDDFHISFK